MHKDKNFKRGNEWRNYTPSETKADLYTVSSPSQFKHGSFPLPSFSSLRNIARCADEQRAEGRLKSGRSYADIFDFWSLVLNSVFLHCVLFDLFLINSLNLLANTSSWDWNSLSHKGTQVRLRVKSGGRAKLSDYFTLIEDKLSRSVICKCMLCSACVFKVFKEK